MTAKVVTIYLRTDNNALKILIKMTNLILMTVNYMGIALFIKELYVENAKETWQYLKNKTVVII